jgi:hypothetical protein
MDYTPQQIAAFVFIASKRRQRELSVQLEVNTLAARGDEKAIRAKFKEWGDG